MADNSIGRVERRPSTVDLSWFIDLDKNGQLDRDPSYQRRSVWTPNDRRYFLDTIFRNYPSPAIFLHKSIDEDGATMYHVVDGKQRISTILFFVQNKMRLATDFGDERLSGKRWRDLDMDLKRSFWNYPIPIEQIDAIEGPVIKDVFARLNKNSRKLTRQELRHARFDGWFITFVEAEVLRPEWRTFKVNTTAKSKRMLDVQNVSELAEIVLRNIVQGFDQFRLDTLYADFDAVDNDETDFDLQAFEDEFASVRNILVEMEKACPGVVSDAAQPFVHLFSLWAFLALEGLTLEQAVEFAPRYMAFMASVSDYEFGPDLDGANIAFVDDDEDDGNDEVGVTDFDEATSDRSCAEDGSSIVNSSMDPVVQYKLGSLGASTEGPQRKARHAALTAFYESGLVAS